MSLTSFVLALATAYCSLRVGAIRTKHSQQLYAYFAEKSTVARQTPDFVPSPDGRDEQIPTSQASENPHFFGSDAWKIQQMPEYPGSAPVTDLTGATGPCEPRCSWTCAPSEVCDQVCEPICAPPTCQISCAQSADRCETRCAPPKCAVVCPTKMCDSCPKCRTVCAPPKCTTMCADNCTKSCQKPQCNWKCRQPDCPKPACEMKCVGLNSCPVPPGNSSALYDVGAASVVGQGEASLDPASLAEAVTAPPPWAFPPGPAPAPAQGPAIAPPPNSAVPNVSLHPSTRGERTVTVRQLEDRWARQDGLAAQQAAQAGQEEPGGDGSTAETVLGPLFQSDGE